jgi:hypothetical protein
MSKSVCAGYPTRWCVKIAADHAQELMTVWSQRANPVAQLYVPIASSVQNADGVDLGAQIASATATARTVTNALGTRSSISNGL